MRAHNRTHEQMGKYKKLDSFSFREMLILMDNKRSEFMIMRDLKIYRGYIEYGGGYAIILHKVPNNYGGRDRVYFECPYCERRVRYLYICGDDDFKCRICANLNYNSQMKTKGCDMTARKMKKFLRDKFDVYNSLSTDDMSVYKPERPRYMHKRTYDKLMKQLRDLQYEYDRHYYKSYMRMIKHFNKDKNILRSLNKL